jgi:hypothetical protein
MPRPQAGRAVIAVTAIAQGHHECPAMSAAETLILRGPADCSASGLKK